MSVSCHVASPTATKFRSPKAARSLSATFQSPIDIEKPRYASIVRDEFILYQPPREELTGRRTGHTRCEPKQPDHTSNNESYCIHMLNGETRVSTDKNQTMLEPRRPVNADTEPTSPIAFESQQAPAVEKMMLPDHRKWSSVVASAASAPTISKSIEVIFSLAWALVLLERDQSEDVLFGIIRPRLSLSYPQLSSNTSIGDITRSLCVGNLKDQTMDTALKAIELQLAEHRRDSQASIDGIPTPTSSCVSAPGFSALLTVHSTSEDEIMFPLLEELQSSEYTIEGTVIDRTCLLILDCSIGDGRESVTYRLHFDESVMPILDAEELLDRMRCVVSRIGLHCSNDFLSDLNDLSQTHGYEPSLRNVSALPSVDVCAHDYIETIVEQQPEAVVVDSWDGSLTYRELSDLASLLATRLLDMGLRPSRDTVPICFEKSMYVVVAILGVLKAGGSFLLVDPTLPSRDLQCAILEVGGRIILTSAMCSSKVSPLTTNTLVLNSRLFDGLKIRSQKWPTLKMPDMYPDDIAYLFRTSGSSEKPKAHRTTHRALSTAALNQVQALSMNQSTNVFQFSDFTNDAFIVELVFSLFAGTRICIPSNEECSCDIEGAMNRYKASFAVLTPTVARFLDSQKLTTLRTLCLRGEPVEQLDLDTWASKVQLMLAYGISECSPLALVRQDVTAATNPRNLGKAGLCGSRCWIVDPNDHEKLLDYGEVGEIIIEGPTVCAGYLNAASHSNPFVEPASWLSSFRPLLQPGGRFIKTGDLAYWNEDGEIIFAGRQDRRVKLNGQKLDLDQVERDVRQALKVLRPLQVVADIVSPGGLIKTKCLAVFVQFQNQADGIAHGDIKLAKTTARPSVDWAALVKAHLGTCLSSILLPKLYFAVDRVPLTRSGKIDRPRLCKLPSTLSSLQLGLSQGERRDIIPPRTTQESQLRQLWADTFAVKEDGINIDDTFSDLGGDSIFALKLVAKAQDAGLQLAFADIFSKPRLMDLATLMNPMQPPSTEFNTKTSTELLQRVSNENQLCLDRIEDVYPATPYQIIALSSSRKKPMLREVYRLGPEIDLNRFKEAWQLVIARAPIFRTRLINQDGSAMQTVLRDSVSWTVWSSLQECLESNQRYEIEPDTCLSHWSLIINEIGDRDFIRSLHASAYDPWTYHLSWQLFSEAYNGSKSSLKSSPFKNLISYSNSQSASTATKAFWTSKLSGFDLPHFPRAHKTGHKPHTTSFIEDTLELPPTADSKTPDLTVSTLITCAWALTITHYTHTQDLVFGLLSNGRTAPIPDILDTLGPTQALIPFRIRWSTSDSIVDLCHQIQAHGIEMIPHQHTPISDIAALDEDCANATSFRNVLNIVHENLMDCPSVPGMQRVMFTERPAKVDYALYLECRLKEGKVGLKMGYDSDLLRLKEVLGLVERFKIVLGEVYEVVTGGKEEVKVEELGGLVEGGK